MTFMMFLVTMTLGQIVESDVLPERLKNIVKPHSHTAYVDWTVTYVGGLNDGLVQRHVTQRAGDTVWDNNMGDALGHHETAYMMREGVSDDAEFDTADLVEIPPEEDAGDRNYLLYDKRTWRVFDAWGHVSADVAREGVRGVPHPFEPTRVGGLAVQAGGHSRNHFDSFGLNPSVLQGFESATFTTSSLGDIDTVTARFDGKRLEWDLDNSRGGRPIRAAFYAGDRLFHSSRTDLVEIDGRWYAKKTKFYKMDITTPYKVVEVQEASFDKPWHLQEITPDDIGMVFGTRVSFIGGDPFSQFWTGTELITPHEYNQLVQLYDIMPHPSIMEWLARGWKMDVEEFTKMRLKRNEAYRVSYIKKHGEIPLLTTKSKEEDDWDIYVRKFIEKHQLTDERLERANKILRRSKQLRDWHLRKYRTQIEKARRNDDTKRLRRYELQVNRIFEKMLKRGLQKLIPKKPRGPTPPSGS